MTTSAFGSGCKGAPPSRAPELNRRQHATPFQNYLPGHVPGRVLRALPADQPRRRPSQAGKEGLIL
jgi:hypothetical protein